MFLYKLCKDEMRSKSQLPYNIHSTMRKCYHFVTCSRLTILLWTLLIVALCNYSTSFACPLEEYEALLELRSSLFRNNYNSPPTWGRQRDCCLWERVICKNSTQRVSKLRLSSLIEYGPFKDWQLNFSIFSSFQDLQQLNLSNNQIIGSLSHMGIIGLRKLEILDLSYNQLIGTIPLSFKDLSSLTILNLGGNMLNGTLDVEGLVGLQNLRKLDLSGNQLNGSLPLSLEKLVSLQHLDLSHNLMKALDVSKNQLLGKVPRQMGDQMLLEILVLRENSLEGPIPIELCKLQSLHILDLSQNNLSGSIPSCFGKMHFREPNSADPYLSMEMVFSFDLGYSSIPDSNSNAEIEFYMISMVDLNTKGNLYPYKIDHLLLMSAIDLSANKLTGNIPLEIGNLNELVQLNLSHNQLTGHIPETFSKLSQIESLDISHNQLSGGIPGQLTQLTSLEVFSVAYNNLSGCTPDFTNQFGTFNVSSYEGNTGLHGPPMQKTCNSDSSPTMPPKVEENQDDSSVEDDAIFFAILAASFVAAFWGCIAFLSCHHTGRHIRMILDGYVDSLIERMLIAARRRTRRPRNRR